jgi:threonine 3-dehydrogenase
MLAVVKERRAPGLSITDVPAPKPDNNQVLVKVEATSICGTDVHIYNWDRWAQNMIKPPLIIGHEFAGSVVEVGNNVKKIKPGDRIAAESHVPCLDCFMCKNDMMHICDNLKIIGIDTNGCFAQYAVIPEVCCWKIEDNIPFDIATIFEPLGNAVHAVSSVDVSGKNCVVFGCGPAGLFTIRVLRALNAGKILAIEINPNRLAMAKEIGADETISGDCEELCKKVIGSCDKVGADVVFEMSGSIDAMKNGIRVLRKGGTFVAFGLPTRPVDIDIANDIIFPSRKIIGVVGRHMFKTWQIMSNLIAQNRLDPSPVITHKFKLTQIEEAMQMINSGKQRCAKVVLIP